MKTTLVFLIVASLCPPSPAVPVLSETAQEILVSDDSRATVLIGAGTLKAKNGSNFTLRSDDGNDYFAEVTGSYVIGDYVYHSNPVNGWVEILGHAD